MTRTEQIVVWRPIPGSSQEVALDTRCNETLFTGSRGPGKTDTQLMRFRRRVGVGYGPFWRGIIFDRQYKHLDDIISKAKRWFPRFNDGSKFHSATNAYKWEWPTGEELLFRVAENEDDYNAYHGQEYPYIAWNELTKWPNDKLYEKMISCNRSSFTPEKDAPVDPRTGKPIAIPPIPLEIFATSNSDGPGHNWVKRRFIDPAPYGTIVKRTTTVFNPQSQQEEEVTRTQVAIFGSYKENVYLDKQYIAGLHNLTDSNLRRSWLEGDWNVTAGGALDDLWDNAVHVIKPLRIPPTWYVDRSFDWGSSKPFSVGWFAEANGEEAQFCDGTTFRPARGSLIQFAEWYGTTDLNKNEGIKMSGGDIAKGIAKRELAMIADDTIVARPWPGPADNQIRDVREADVDTIEKKMSDNGINWTVSDKSPGSRRNGLELFRERLLNAVRKEGPAIYFVDTCRASISTLPVLPRDSDHPDDVDSEAEDHAYDMVRYRVLKSSNRYATNIKFKWPT